MDLTLAGKYSYISMTKVDIYNQRPSTFYSTAVHEYIHSHLVRTTFYGNFMLYFNTINSFEPTNKKIINLLAKNEEKVHEAAATLIELLYIAARYGYQQAISDMKNLPNFYSKVIHKYKYIINPEYISKSASVHLKSIQNDMTNDKIDDKTKQAFSDLYLGLQGKSQEQTNINVVMYLVLRAAEMALDIDLNPINPDLWGRPGKLANFIRNQNSEKYYPNSRFKKIMKIIFPQDYQGYSDLPFLNDETIKPITYQPNLEGFILDKYDDVEVEQYSLIKNKLDENINLTRPRIYSIDLLELESFLYAQPYPLNRSSSEYLFGDNFLIYKQESSLKEIYGLKRFTPYIHIHPETGIIQKIRYDVSIHLTNNPKITNKLSSRNIDFKASCKIDNTKGLLALLEDYTNAIYITGCPRSEHLIDEFKKMNKKNNMYITSAAGLTSSLSFINKYFLNMESEITSTKYGDVLLIRNQNLIFYHLLLPGIDLIINKVISDGDLLIKKPIRNNKNTQFSEEDWQLLNLLLEENYKHNATYANTIQKELQSQKLNIFRSLVY